MMPHPQRVVRFGAFEANLGSGELFSNGMKVRLPEQPFTLLAILLESPGEVVSRDALRRRLWPEDTFVDFDRSLNTAASKLREALGDAADDPRYIQTLPKRGYRFIAPLSEEVPADACPPGEVGQVGTGGRPRIRVVWAVGTLILVSILAFAYFRWRASSDVPVVVRTVRITNDGFGKSPEVATDGPRIYFSVWKGGRGTLAQVAATGGETELIPTPFLGPTMNACLAGISPDGQHLLMVSGRERTRVNGYPVWSVSTSGHAGRRVGDLIANGVDWTPDGGKITYVTSNQVWVADALGRGACKVAEHGDMLTCPRWSPDGKRIRFSSITWDSFQPTIWEVAADGGQVHRVFPGWEVEQPWSGRWTADGKYFVFNSDSNLWAVREKTGWGARGSPKPFQLTSGPLSFGAPFPSADGRKLFAVGDMRRGELLRYDINRSEFVSVFPELSADGFDYSRDGEWMAYVTYPQGYLWRSRMDGSQRQQLTSAPMKVVMPRWSPDGQEIVFNGRLPGQAFKAYLIKASGGIPKEIAPGPDPDASWFPDGKGMLVVGEREPHNKLFFLDLKTGNLSPVPGSDGMHSSQLSPDGRYVSAVRTFASGSDTILLDLKKQTWSRIAPDCYWHTWTRDSSRFFCLEGKGEGIGGFEIATGKYERVVSLAGFRGTGTLSSAWLGIAPDGSPMILKDVGNQEIYALEWKAP